MAHNSLRAIVSLLLELSALRQAKDHNVILLFAERDTAIGQVINDYLEKKCELEDHAVHLLFAANRWELV